MNGHVLRNPFYFSAYMRIEYIRRRKAMSDGNVKRIYRSRDNRMIAGVCSGLATYFAADPTIVRLLFVLGMVAGLATFWIYIAMMIIIPEEP
jgi:phage shock protein C